MKQLGKLAVCLTTLAVIAPSVRGGDEALPGDPYASVVARNIFGLNPPLPPTPPPPTDPPPKIIPNGITDILGQVQVLFKVPATPKKSGPPAVDQNYILSAGQRQDDIEVVKIDEAAGIVTFNNHGETQVLPLVATEPSATPAAAPPGHPPGAPPPGRPGAHFTPGLVNPAGGFRPGGLSYDGGRTNPGNPNKNAVLGNAPARVKTFNAASQIPEGMTPEVQTIAIEANRLMAQEKGDGSAAIYPITDLTKENHPDNGTEPSP